MPEVVSAGGDAAHRRTCTGRLACLVLAGLLSGPSLAAESIVHPFRAAQTQNAPEEVVLAVEIPAGSFTKYEIGEDGLKVIGVPTDKIDPTYARIRDLADLPEIERQRIEAFFRVYKDLPAEHNPVELNGWGDAAEAKALVTESIRRFEVRRDAGN